MAQTVQLRLAPEWSLWEGDALDDLLAQDAGGTPGCTPRRGLASPGGAQLALALPSPTGGAPPPPPLPADVNEAEEGGSDPADDGDDAPAPDADGWQCADAQHRRGCTRCRPPPGAHEDVGGWTLRGDKGLKNGERKLRTSITRRAEWRSDDRRCAGAAAADAAGMCELAAALRCRDSSRLRKPMLFELCRLWRLKSDIWEPRPAAAPGSRRRRAAPSRVALPPARLAASPRGLSPSPSFSFDCNALVPSHLQSDAVTIFLTRDLDACLEAHRVWSRMPSMHAAVAAEPLAPVRLLAPASLVRALLPAVRWLQDTLRSDAIAIRGYAAQLEARGGGSDSPAWRVTCSLPPLAERAAHALLGVLNACASTLDDTQAALAATSSPPSSADLGYVQDITRSLDAISAFVQRAQGGLAQLRAGPASQYLSAAAAVCERSAALVAAMGAVATARCAWQARVADTALTAAGGNEAALAAARPPPGHLRNFVHYVVATRVLPDEPRVLAPLAPFVAASGGGDAAAAYASLRIAGGSGSGGEPYGGGVFPL